MPTIGGRAMRMVVIMVMVMLVMAVGALSEFGLDRGMVDAMLDG